MKNENMVSSSSINLNGATLFAFNTFSHCNEIMSALTSTFQIIENMISITSSLAGLSLSWTERRFLNLQVVFKHGKKESVSGDEKGPTGNMDCCCNTYTVGAIII